ncbi:MAG: RagB/SusD family nutrient uptake outer membrane protein [Bacteroidales bacterium]|nr:RagB/SusD family nutrient uptake outer membrane protein [Bacteroidales bacterium]
MKSKSIIGVLTIFFTIVLTTSCADMLDIDSNRVVYEKDHHLNSTADSVYSTLGILQSLQQIADRYVILGEVRGDLVTINDVTKTSLRNLANFEFDAENEYLDVKDYYAVINNCNYLIAHIDTTIAQNNGRVMVDEYVTALTIRAWTYMQLAINYGKVPFYTEPITSIPDSEKDYPLYGIKELAPILAEELLPFKEYETPVWGGLTVGTKLMIPSISLVLADLYLWSEMYDKATEVLLDFLTEEGVITHVVTQNNISYRLTGLVTNNGAYVYKNPLSIGNLVSVYSSVGWTDYIGYGVLTDNRCVIPLAISTEYGTTTEVHKLFYSEDGSHQLAPSLYWKNLSDAQTYCMATDLLNEVDPIVEYFPKNTDGRSAYYHNPNDEYTLNDIVYAPMKKFNKLTNSGVDKYQNSEHTFINIYRGPISYLRAAEAFNCYARKTEDREYAIIAYDLLRDAFEAFKGISKITGNSSMFDVPIEVEKIFKSIALQGVHARGCGDAHLDTTYSLKPSAIAAYLQIPQDGITFNDTIEYIEQRIIDELALEAAFEGNRFTDLIRFAERRNEPEFLIDRVANRSGEYDPELAAKLQDKSNWYLPLK